jgi:uncharacterized membrane-anchored protein YhcB (DUF1043 family)
VEVIGHWLLRVLGVTIGVFLGLVFVMVARTYVEVRMQQELHQLQDSMEHQR